VNFSFDSFLNGKVTDVDFKRDQYVRDNDDQKDAVYQLKLLTKASPDAEKGCRVFNSKREGLGIQFSARKMATDGNPFCKVYAKDIELKTQSRRFAFEFDLLNTVPPCLRFESTVKNQKHFNRLMDRDEKEPFNLRTIVNLSPEQIDYIIKKIIRKHIDYPECEHALDDAGKMNLSEILAYQVLVMTRFNLETAHRLVLRLTTDKDQRLRLKRKLSDVYRERVDQAVKVKAGISSQIIRDLFDDNLPIDSRENAQYVINLTNKMNREL